MDNIRMAYNVYQVCLEEGVKRLVALSSNHASDYYEELVSAGKMEMITPDMRPLSPQIYGWAKSAMENLGFTFACGLGHNVEDRRRLESVHIRIGAPREMDFERFAPANLERMHRFLGAYLSARDQLQLVVRSIEAENTEDENGVPFQIFYGISGNTHRFWSIANARRVIGYEPEDDSELLFADQIYEFLKRVREMREDGS